MCACLFYSVPLLLSLQVGIEERAVVCKWCFMFCKALVLHPPCYLDMHRIFFTWRCTLCVLSSYSDMPWATLAEMTL
jgi:hypothetical protein